MRKDTGPDEDVLNTSLTENEEVSGESSETEAIQQRKPKKEKVKPAKQQEAYAGDGGEEEEETEENEEEGEEYEGEEEEVEEGEEEEDEEIESILEEQFDAISEKVKNYIMKTSDNQKMKDLVKYGALAALAVYGLRRGGVLRGLVVSTALSYAAKQLVGEKSKTAVA